MLMPVNNRRHRPMQISYTRLKEHRGSLRLWQEGLRLNDAAFTAGTSVQIKDIPELSTMIIERGEGRNTISSRKRKHNPVPVPILDVNNQLLEKTFGDVRLLRVSYYKGKIVAQAHSNELNRIVAMDDLRTNAKSGVLTMGTVCVGGGICSSAIKEGAASEGMRIESEWVIDIENKYLQSTLDNTEVANKKTIIVEGAVGDVEVNQLTPVNVLNLSLPCTGYSSAGRAKNRLDNPESHKTAGTAILKAIEIIETYMPPIISNENVKAFASSASADLLAGRLRELGYHVENRVYGGEMGTLEDRQRSIMIAVHPSLSMEMDNLVAVMTKEKCMSEIQEDIPLDDPMWKEYKYLADKEKSDIEKGKGFRRQLLDGPEASCGVLGAGYAKARSTEPFWQHPTDPNLSRLFTETEHAAAMKIPPKLVANMSKTTAHQILGQSGSYALFVAIGSWLAKEVNQALNPRERHLQESPIMVSGVQEKKTEITSGQIDDPESLDKNVSDEAENQMSMFA